MNASGLCGRVSYEATQASNTLPIPFTAVAPLRGGGHGLRSALMRTDAKDVGTRTVELAINCEALVRPHRSLPFTGFPCCVRMRKGLRSNFREGNFFDVEFQNSIPPFRNLLVSTISFPVICSQEFKIEGSICRCLRTEDISFRSRPRTRLAQLLNKCPYCCPLNPLDVWEILLNK